MQGSLAPGTVRSQLSRQAREQGGQTSGTYVYALYARMPGCPVCPSQPAARSARKDHPHAHKSFDAKKQIGCGGGAALPTELVQASSGFARPLRRTCMSIRPASTPCLWPGDRRGSPVDRTGLFSLAYKNAKNTSMQRSLAPRTVRSQLSRQAREQGGQTSGAYVYALYARMPSCPVCPS